MSGVSLIQMLGATLFAETLRQTILNPRSMYDESIKLLLKLSGGGDGTPTELI